jgi:hypothetical protein
MNTELSFGEKENIEEPIVDASFHDLYCQGCNKHLLIVGRAAIGELESKFRAQCTFCGDHSRVVTIVGKPYLGYPEGLTYTDQVFGDIIEIHIGKSGK